MSPAGDNHGMDDLSRAVRRQQQRHKRWEAEGERPLWKNLSMVGALGWLIVIPTLLGVALGRWLDHTFETGILFTAALIFVGIVAGGSFAWHRMNSG